MEIIIESCGACEGRGCEECAGVGAWPKATAAQHKRIEAKFFELLRASDPDHPWVVKYDREQAQRD